MTYAPMYRNYLKVLQGEEADALEWFKAQIWAKLGEEDRAEIEANGWPHIRHDIDRTVVGGGFYRQDQATLKDFFHLWKLKDPYKTYGDKRFVIRKDGTLKIDSAVECVEGMLRSRRMQRREADIGGQNMAEWNSLFNHTVRDAGNTDHLRANITLSKTVLGNCTISLSSWHWRFNIKRTIRIDQIRDFLTWAETVKEGAKQWGE